MKKLVTLAVFTFAFFISCEANKNETEMTVSNKEKTVAVLNSIETGAQDPVAYINANNYVQHNQGVADGLAGFSAVLGILNEAGGGKVEIQRVFQDGEYVIAHTKYDFFGPKAGFDIFRFEDDLIVEHWDNLQEIVTETASGRTQFDGPTEVVDVEKTAENKKLVKNLLNDVFLGANPDKTYDYYIPQSSTISYTYRCDCMMHDVPASLHDRINAHHGIFCTYCGSTMKYVG